MKYLTPMICVTCKKKKEIVEFTTMILLSRVTTGIG